MFEDKRQTFVHDEHYTYMNAHTHTNDAIGTIDV